MYIYIHMGLSENHVFPQIHWIFSFFFSDEHSHGLYPIFRHTMCIYIYMYIYVYVAKNPYEFHETTAKNPIKSPLNHVGPPSDVSCFINTSKYS